jgi:hypothetical protein
MTDGAWIPVIEDNLAEIFAFPSEAPMVIGLKLLLAESGEVFAKINCDKHRRGKLT